MKKIDYIKSIENIESTKSIENIDHIDHIGYAVKDMDDALRIFGLLGYEFSPVKIDEYRKVNVCLAKIRGVRIEIRSPLKDTKSDTKSNPKSPIDSILAKNGATPYHICYCVNNINKTADELRNAGFLPIGSVAKSEPLGGNVCFMFSSDIGVIELIEYTDRR